METALPWLIKLLLAHLLTDFVLQPASWIRSRNEKHFASPFLYLHGGVTALAAFLLIGPAHWLTVLILLITHTAIDGWKSYRPQTSLYFLLDQALHLLVILACWYFTFFGWKDVKALLQWMQQPRPLILITAFVLVTQPAGILIGQLTHRWRKQLPEAESLGNAGKWIGILERLIILVLVLYNQFGAIGLLVAAKGLLRFNEPNRQEIKTEYLLIGTLLSISFSLLTGIVVSKLLA